jgi:hypothetical protein
MLDYFPKYFSSRAIYCYLATLALVSIVFYQHAMPFQFMLFGIVAVLVFFVFGNKLTMGWQRFSVKTFSKRLFFVALLIRVVYVIFIYLYYMSMTGEPYAFHAADEVMYQLYGEIWRNNGFDAMRDEMKYAAISDSGYPWFLGFEYLLLGTHVLPARIVKCFFSAFSCVLMYNLAKRNFGDAVGRMTGIFCMLMPNMWLYCGITLKETEMAFLVTLFAERADAVLHSPKIKVVGVIIPALCILLMFTFRTALGAVMFASLAAGLIFTNSKQLQVWKKIMYTSVFAVWMFLTVGVEIVQETQQLWEGRATNQETGMESRSQRRGGNQFAQYATATLFAPAIFTIPFSSMVEIENQENQMMMNGANFVKNVLSGFVIFALFSMLFSGEWRKRVLPIALTCGYLVVLVFSNFAQSERFHFPILAFELMFAAYGISLMKNKHKRWYGIWLMVVGVAIIGWAWIKLAGRGLA